MGTLLVKAVVHVDGSGSPCSPRRLDETELLNAVDSLQRHLSARGIRVSLSTSREQVPDGADAPARDLVYINGTEMGEMPDRGACPLDSSTILHAGLAAASELL